MKNDNTLVWLWNIAKKQLLRIIILSVSSMLSSLSFLGLALVSRKAINIAVGVIPSDNVKADIINCAFILVAILIAQLLLTVLDSHLKAVISGKLEKDLRYRIFKSATAKKYRELNNFHSGEILNRFMGDVDIVVSGVANFIPNTLSIFTKIIGGLIVIAAISKSFALIVICVGVAIILCATVISPFYKKLHKRVRRETGEVQSMTQECIENIVVIKTFSSRLPLLKRLDSIMNRLYKSKIHRNHVSNVANSGIFLVFTVGYYATLCWGALSIASGNGVMDYGTLMAFLQIVSQIRAPLFNASGLITSLYGTIASAERIIALENLPEESTSSQFDPISTYDKLKSIKAESLSFGYNDNNDVITKSSFEIQKGASVAVIGASGTGKSTLFRLLLGLFDATEGSLALMVTDGQIDINASTRSLFAYVPQGNFVLSGTIADNIKFGNPCVDDGAVEKALKSACLYDFVNSLPDGINTVIGERGLGLSEGQIQRVAVARALCCGAPILLLDECTSALDAETEVEMLNNITKLDNKTVLFISHRDAALSVCKQQLILENGVFTLK